MLRKLLNLLSGLHHWQALNSIALHDIDFGTGDAAAELYHLLMEVLSSELTNDGTNIDYAALRVSSLYSEFRYCTGKLCAFDPSVLPNQEARLAFWINLYNMLVLDGVVALALQDGNVERYTGKAFFSQAAYIVGGHRMSCDDVEHGILRANRRPTFYQAKYFHVSDPRLKWVIEPFDVRVHFALNCGSRSCPPIRAYSPEKLDSQLDLATRSHLTANVQFVHENHTLYLSSIFKWFAADFGGREGIIEFILLYLADEEELLWLSKQRDRVSLQYKPYDWSLNNKF